MPAPKLPQNPAALLLKVLEAFDLGMLQDFQPAGGTASPKWAVRTPQGRFLVRVRPPEFADEACIRFDHQALRRLFEAGVPVPVPVAARDGTTWFCLNEHRIEVLRWVEGDPFDPSDLAARPALGRFLATFHQVLAHEDLQGKAGRLREDHPALMRPYLDALRARTGSADEQRQLDRIAEQLDLVERQLDAGMYAALPHCLIHGDLHPGNLRFRNSQVAAVYDFDYLNVQARARDLSDGLVFFASTRPAPLVPDDIRSLTQPFTPESDQAALLLQGYQETCRLTDAEWSALPLLIRSRWIQMRLRGSRKVPDEQKVGFVLDRFFQVINWLDHEGPPFFQQARAASAALTKAVRNR